MFDRLDPTFEPSSQTKEAMQYVRKRTRLLGGIRHPGLFGIHGYTVDWAMFLLMLLFEAIGLFFLFDLVVQRKAPPIAAVIIVAGALILDLLLAYFHHRYSTGINAALEMESILSSKAGGTDGKITAERNADQIRNRKRVSFILSVLLILAAAAKFVVFLGLAPKKSPDATAIIIVMALIYAVTAIIHIKVTGYLIHGVWASWLHDRDIEKFKRSNGVECAATDHVIELPSYPDFQKQISVQSHSIISDVRPGGTETVYMLKCSGLLFDQEIEEFCNKIIDAKARSDFVLKAMELQLRML